ncbi:SH3 domain-containing protein [Phocaeicola plebeius]|uniref:SH3 domain-containing protein n=1 Tax=Phocaeicola plebeius TaxID=310297 RepID=UPI0026F11280|nr:SH3 domain-containing protein [Phocaeicola plebeius]
MMNRFRLQQSICILGKMSLCRSSAIVKSILFLFISFSLCTEAFADYYRVTASKGLNVRASANKNSEVLGQLPQGDVVDVISIENGWANINYNGWQGYVSVSYLTAVTSEGKATSSSSKKSWNFFSWLFNSEGESAWFTGLKWIFFLGVAIFLIRIAFLVIVKMIAYGILLGIIFLLIGFIIKWIGWIEADTMWFIAKCGYCLGNLLGLLDSIFHFGEILDDAADSGSSSSSNNGNGLKRYSVTVDGNEYILTQDSQYSECDYTDQFGGKWSCDSQGFHRV